MIPVKLKVGIVFLVSVIILSACGGGQSLPPLSANAVILAFGDSLTAGNGAPQDGSYPAQLANLTHLTVVNAGISGEMSSDGLQRLGGLLDQYKPGLLILCHGGNDLLRKSSLTLLENNLEEMIALARDRSVPVLMLGVPAPGIFLSSAKVYEKVADDTGVAFIPDLIADVLSQPAMKSDTVHPNETGYSKIAGEIFLELQDLGAL